MGLEASYGAYGAFLLEANSMNEQKQIRKMAKAINCAERALTRKQGQKFIKKWDKAYNKIKEHRKGNMTSSN